MLDERRRRFGPYLRDLADRMHLKDWAVVLEDGPPDDRSCMASVDCVDGRKLATVLVSDHFLSDTPEEQRHTLVHELIHAHFDMASTLAFRGLDKQGRQAFRSLMEYGVDGLADALAPLLPLPGDPIPDSIHSRINGNMVPDSVP